MTYDTYIEGMNKDTKVLLTVIYIVVVVVVSCIIVVVVVIVIVIVLSIRSWDACVGTGRGMHAGRGIGGE